MTFSELIDNFLPHFLLLIISLGFILLVRPEPPDKSGLPETHIPYAYFAARFVKWLRLAGVILLIVAFAWIVVTWYGKKGTVPTQTSSSVPHVYLIGIGYSTWAWNPQQVDLRTAATEGIVAHSDTPLGLLDVRVSVPDALSGTYQTQVEVYANDTDFIGKTKMAPLAPGVVELGDVMPASYVYDTLKNNWRVQAEWSELTIYVNVFDQNSAKALSTEKTRIKLTQANGNSWWTSPPYANFVSITYQVNDAEKQFMDLRRAREALGSTFSLAIPCAYWKFGIVVGQLMTPATYLPRPI